MKKVLFVFICILFVSCNLEEDWKDVEVSIDYTLTSPTNDTLRLCTKDTVPMPLHREPFFMITNDGTDLIISGFYKEDVMQYIRKRYDNLKICVERFSYKTIRTYKRNRITGCEIR